MITHLLDHLCRVWRLVETKGEYREVIRGYGLISTGIPCALTRNKNSLAKLAAGVSDVGERGIYFDYGVDLEERDLVQVYQGSQAPLLLEVESVSRPRGNHAKAKVSTFKGKVPEHDSVS